jgi:hypothetical protein
MENQTPRKTLPAVAKPASTTRPTSRHLPGWLDIWKLFALPFLAFILIPILAIFVRVDPAVLLANLQQEQVRQAIQLSLVTSLSTVGLTVVFGTPVAYYLSHRHYRFYRLVDTLVDLPTVLPPAVADSPLPLWVEPGSSVVNSVAPIAGSGLELSDALHAGSTAAASKVRVSGRRKGRMKASGLRPQQEPCPASPGPRIRQIAGLASENRRHPSPRIGKPVTAARAQWQMTTRMCSGNSATKRLNTSP